MSSSTQPTDFSDLFTSLQKKLRQQRSITATEDIAKAEINTALHDMHLGTKEKFPWAERSDTLTTQPEYTTGTVTISKGSTALAGVSTAWSTNNDFGVANVRAGGKFVINGTVDVYEVSSVTDGTNIVLLQNYVGDDVSAGTYIYFEDEYALADDFLRPLNIRYFDQARQVELLQRREFQEIFVRNKTTGKIRAAAILDKPFSGSTAPVRKVVFHKPPDKAYLLPYSYITDRLAVTSAGVAAIQLVNDDDEPIIPLYARHIIVFYALANLYRDQKNDTRAAEARAEYLDGLSRLTSDIEFSQNRAQMRPRSYLPRRRGRHGLRHVHVLGTAFDERRE